MTTVKINIPKSLDFEATFGTMPNARQHQIKFIIHQMNYYTKKEGHLGLYHKAYFQFLGLSSADLTTILIVLMDLGIIQRISRGTNESNCVSKYKMVKTYSIEDSVTTTYTLGEKGTPKFIYKYIADDCKVKVTAQSKFKKQMKPLKPKTISKWQNIAEEQQLTIQSLKAELADLRASITNSDMSVSPTDIMPVIEDKPIVHVPLEHEYSYASDKYFINDWAYLISNTNCTDDELQEEIYDADENKECLIEGVKIIKKYDIKTLGYNVQILLN